jgi:ubiquinol-cytochrome c reductase cytochrome b subunit
MLVHLSTLHKDGSSSPISAVSGYEKVHFYYYFFYKDLFFIIAVLFALMFVVCFHPNAFNHPDNFVEANPLVTPTHIVPE